MARPTAEAPGSRQDGVLRQGTTATSLSLPWRKLTSGCPPLRQPWGRPGTDVLHTGMADPNMHEKCSCRRDTNSQQHIARSGYMGTTSPRYCG